MDCGRCVGPAVLAFGQGLGLGDRREQRLRLRPFRRCRQSIDVQIALVADGLADRALDGLVQLQ